MISTFSQKWQRKALWEEAMTTTDLQQRLQLKYHFWDQVTMIIINLRLKLQLRISMVVWMELVTTTTTNSLLNHKKLLEHGDINIQTDHSS